MHKNPVGRCQFWDLLIIAKLLIVLYSASLILRDGF